MHAVALAQELGIAEVIVPPDPGGFSAWGMLQSAVRQDFSEAFFRNFADLDTDDLHARFARLGEMAVASLLGEGVGSDRISLVQRLDMRYQGQEHTLTVTLPNGASPDRDDPFTTLRSRFEDTYSTRYGHSNPGASMETVTLRLTALGDVGRPPPPGQLPAGPTRQRPFQDDAGPVLDRLLSHLPFQPGNPDSGVLHRRPRHPGGSHRHHRHPTGRVGHHRRVRLSDHRGASAVKPDPITIEILRNAFVMAAEEMNAALIRSAYTPVIYESKDCAVALIDSHHRVLGQSSGVPLFLGNLEACTLGTEEMFGRSVWNEGDIWIMNDPYLTGTHMHDVTIFAPIFYHGDLAGFAASRAHWLDIGSKDPGVPMDSTEVFQEGVRLPPTQVMRAGEPVKDIWSIIETNVRFPPLGDRRHDRPVRGGRHRRGIASGLCSTGTDGTPWRQPPRRSSTRASGWTPKPSGPSPTACTPPRGCSTPTAWGMNPSG